MALSIKNDHADHLARQLVELTGESLTTAVTVALRERVDRERRARGPDLASRIAPIRARAATLAVRDSRPAEEILGYDEHGLPT
jgi:antitoxin VapB